eukprot:1815048-Prymnesium_polylepis.1
MLLPQRPRHRAFQACPQCSDTHAPDVAPIVAALRRGTVQVGSGRRHIPEEQRLKMSRHSFSTSSASAK